MLQQLIDQLHETPAVEVEVVNVSGIKISSPRNIIRALRTIFAIFRIARDVDLIFVHVNLSSMHKIAPVCLAASRLFRKPLVIRQAGGDGYYDLPPRRARFDRWLYRCADLCLFELKKIVEKAQDDGLVNVKWYSNSRAMLPLSEIPTRPSCRRFIFLGHVKPTKGVLEIIRAVESMEKDCVVDFYGPFHDGLSEAIFSGLKDIRYCGTIEPENVTETLISYDVLLLPTYYSGEGYPGVVLEAYGVGMPVICTHWQGLPEIVDESCGILVDPKSVEALRCAMQRIMSDDDFFSRLQEGVIRKRQEFSSDLWRDRFIEYCKDLVQ